MNAGELIEFLGEDASREQGSTVTRLVADSKRFLSFADENRAKIRKKLRMARTPDSLRSVMMELEIARHFVEDRRCAVEYERYGQGRIRAPDLTITFRERTVFHLEVTSVQLSAVGTAEREGKLARLVCDKLGQLIPEYVNVVALAAESGPPTAAEVAGSMRRLKERVEGRDPEILSRGGFRGPAGFFKGFQWLSAIVIWTAAESGRPLWVNPQARRAIPAEIVRLLTT